MFGSDSDSTPSPLMSIDVHPITDGVATVGSDGGESLYHSVDEENDQVCSFNFTVHIKFDCGSIDGRGRSASPTR